MYPFVRMAWQLFRHRNDPPMTYGECHVSRHLILPWDLDFWAELNNGRTLTLYDLGRIPAGHRMGLTGALKRRGWGLTVAGSTPRYRRRITVFERITMKTRAVGWDARFLYVEQSMWKDDGECAGHVLIRSATTSKAGIVPPTEVAREMGIDPGLGHLPDWVTAWIDADAKRPWPPMQD